MLSLASHAFATVIIVRLITSAYSQYMLVAMCHVRADDGILHVQLLKRNRKGHYSNGSTAADTFWYSLLQAAQGSDRLPGHHPPTRYYSMPYEADDLEEPV